LATSQNVAVKPITKPVDSQQLAPKTTSINYNGVDSPKFTNTAYVGSSISDMLKKISSERTAPVSTSENVQTIESVYGKPVKLDEKRVCDLWSRYARSIEQSDTHLYTLMQRQPKVDGNVVIAMVSTGLQETKMLDSRDLVDFLRKETGVSSLVLRVEVEEDKAEVNRRVVYTSREKLEFMIEQNPSIAELVKKFSLDVDF